MCRYPEKLGGKLKDWGCSLKSDKSTYFAMFPRSWSVYEQFPDISKRCLFPFNNHDEEKFKALNQFDHRTYQASMQASLACYTSQLQGEQLSCWHIYLEDREFRYSSSALHFKTKLNIHVGTTVANVSLMFTFQNGTGSDADIRAGHVNTYVLLRIGERVTGRGREVK